ncbi:MAG: hypothetical protein MB54_02250 [marine actinobacterium MedAcidi-G2B]|nr:MAG: hypothetical protein MB54_02250 [marine actinobacterium MedAcidi-G2B]MAU50232.1 transcriptional regulator [Actinomycetota bacterium]MDC0246026.1 hypothetical protein [Acidimicrobiaceae bacterium]|tara:strand:- start:1213 stop:1860 length:648 start_codon:yes stop_codon:yes gene_type:complete
MSYQSESNLLILHALRIRGFVQLSEIVISTRLKVEEVESHLDSFKENNLVNYREGRIEGWMLTQEGRGRSQQLVTSELESSGFREEINSNYQGFLSSNQRFLSLCTDWQLRTVNGEQEINDHSDTDYDEEVIARLVDINGEIQPVCESLADSLNRFEGYSRRFSEALHKVQNNEPEWFTKPMIDSYHTIWFELHENLLVTLGIERTKETDGNNDE